MFKFGKLKNNHKFYCTAVNFINTSEIITTRKNTKNIIPFIERLITKVLNMNDENRLHSSRLILSALKGNRETFANLIELSNKVVSKKNLGGYIKSIKVPFRKGDGADMVMLRLSV